MCGCNQIACIHNPRNALSGCGIG